jgi:hypothetical protein
MRQIPVDFGRIVREPTGVEQAPGATAPKPGGV